MSGEGVGGGLPEKVLKLMKMYYTKIHTNNFTPNIESIKFLL